MTAFRACVALSGVSLAGAIQVQSQPCHTAVKGDDCYAQVQWSMQRGIRYHPEKFPNEFDHVTTFEEVQAYLHGLDSMAGVCAEPCGVPKTSVLMGKAHADECKTAVEGDECHAEVSWAMEHGIYEHKEWYGMLTSSSTAGDFQALLHGLNKFSKICAAPCHPENECRTASQGDDCFPHVQWAMLRGIKNHPDKFPLPLNETSTFEEVQAYLHGVPALAGVCAKPCEGPSMLSQMRLPSPSVKDEAAKECFNAVPGDECHIEVKWAMEHGIVEHPEWYGVLTMTSSFKDFQALLHGMHKLSQVCSAPCEEEAPDVEDEHPEDACHTAVEGDDCYSHVQWAMQRGIRYHPDKFPMEFDTSTSFEKVQAYLHTLDNVAAACPTPCKEAASPEPRVAAAACRTAVEGDDCHTQVKWAMEHGIAEHPEWYGMLTGASSFEDFQWFLHGLSTFSSVCPNPCDESPEAPVTVAQESKDGYPGDQLPETKQESADEYPLPDVPVKQESEYTQQEAQKSESSEYPLQEAQQKAEEEEELPPFLPQQAQEQQKSMQLPAVQESSECRTAVKGDKCYKVVAWVMSRGIAYHGERFKGLNAESTFEEVQEFVFNHRKQVCTSRPCAPSAQQPAAEQARAVAPQEEEFVTTTGQAQISSADAPLLEDESEDQPKRNYDEGQDTPAPMAPQKVSSGAEEDEPPPFFPKKPSVGGVAEADFGAPKTSHVEEAEFGRPKAKKQPSMPRFDEADMANQQAVFAPEPTAPTNPGCYMMQPQGCLRHPHKGRGPGDWSADPLGEEVGSDRDEMNCMKRSTQLDTYCGVTHTKMMWVPPAAPKKPYERGCYVWRPGACPKKNSFVPRHDWDRDTWGESNQGADRSEAACMARKAQFDHFCGTGSAKMLYVG